MQHCKDRPFIRPMLFLNDEQRLKLAIIKEENGISEPAFINKILADALDKIEVYAKYTSNVKQVVELPKADIKVKKKQ